MQPHPYLLKFMREHNLNVGEIAKLAGCTTSQVYDFITRRQSLGDDRVVKIANAMQIPEEVHEKLIEINGRVREKTKGKKAKYVKEKK